MPVVWQWRRNRGHRERDTRGGIAPPAPTLRIPPSDPAFAAGLRPIPPGRLGAGARRPAADITGLSPKGDPVKIRIDEFDRPILLAFLHTRCGGCDDFWRGFRDVEAKWPVSVSPAVVTKGPDTVVPAEIDRAALGVDRVPVVMSDEAWVDYQVLGYPFFVLVDGTSRSIVGETVGFGWSDVVSMIGSAGH